MTTRIYHSSVIPLSVEETWARVRDFNGLPGWHPAVVESVIEEQMAPDQLGCVRNYRRHDGLRLRERLLALDDVELVCRYSLLEPPIPVTNYIATLSLSAITDVGHTFIRWSAEWECAAGDEAALVAGIGIVFSSGLDSLKVAAKKAQQ